MQADVNLHILCMLKGTLREYLKESGWLGEARCHASYVTGASS